MSPALETVTVPPLPAALPVPPTPTAPLTSSDPIALPSPPLPPPPPTDCAKIPLDIQPNVVMSPVLITHASSPSPAAPPLPPMPNDRPKLSGPSSPFSASLASLPNELAPFACSSSSFWKSNSFLAASFT